MLHSLRHERYWRYSRAFVAIESSRATASSWWAIDAFCSVCRGVSEVLVIQTNGCKSRYGYISATETSLSIFELQSSMDLSTAIHKKEKSRMVEQLRPYFLSNTVLFSGTIHIELKRVSMKHRASLIERSPSSKKETCWHGYSLWSLGVEQILGRWNAGVRFYCPCNLTVVQFSVSKKAW